ncbi:MAG TPA: YciI family protein [Actinomycetota bacterium]|nr:YciI family protein [Actinomycetota bacterium]
MKYALLIYGEEGSWDALSDDEREAEYRRYSEFGDWLRERGWNLGGEELASSSSATCVRVEGSRTESTDGPYAETKEQLGGFYLIECENLDQAIEAAARIPAASRGTIEVRPIVDHG